ncbi:MAG: 4-(cytidine 5'-diphospho)-2-C-methyl-D-erythritol kinase [Eggerthellaceae bacterium]|nr:4-(cytidine 5'-diphospho)-2-C-methyl-D-erythritol kinase [Eggerthellaceae bacterium]
MSLSGRQQPLAAQQADQPIDLVNYARETTIKDMKRLPQGTIKLVAPAKVNLLLGIGNRRDDGYHDVFTVMHALMLHDVLYMHSCAPDDPTCGMLVDAELEATSDMPGAEALRVRVSCTGSAQIEAPDVAPEDNLVAKAVFSLARELAVDDVPLAEQVVEIKVEKHIPSQAGLGGGSSDAAAALVGAAHLWGIGADHPAIIRAARSIGADVAFFLYGGCARLSGSGDIFERALAPRNESVVLIRPDVGLSTAEVYRSFDAMGEALDEQVCELARQAEAASEVTLYNNLQAPACMLLPELSQVFSWIEKQPQAAESLLSGSGSAVFVVCGTFEQARKLAASAKQQGWWARTTTFSSLSAAVVPNR